MINIKKIIVSGKFLAIISGLLAILAFPPSPFGFVAYFCLLPLMYSYVKDDFYFGFEKGLFYGFVLNLGVLYWLAINNGADWYYAVLSMLSGVIFVSVFYGIAGAVISLIGRKLGQKIGLLSFPFVFGALELLRSFGVMGFTWNNLCYTQTYYKSIIQIASVTGPYGISIWIIFLNLILFNLVINWKNKQKQKIFSVLFAVIFMIPILFGSIVLMTSTKSEKEQTVSVGLIQPNVDPNEKWNRKSFTKNMQSLHDLTDSVTAGKNLDLVVWPETAPPTYLRSNKRHSFDNIKKMIKEKNIYLLTGVPDYEYLTDKTYNVYNATFFINPNSGSFDYYRKNQLVPFGEYIPFSEYIPNLNKLNLGQGNFIAGNEINVFSITEKNVDVKLTSAICYESTFPDLIRKGIKKGSEMLVIVSNDAWFGTTSAPFLHAQIAKFRAVENRVPVIRSANTGVSLILDRYGRVLTKSKFGEQIWLSADVQKLTKMTYYTKYGNWIAWICVIVTVGLCITVIFRSIKDAK